MSDEPTKAPEAVEPYCILWTGVQDSIEDDTKAVIHFRSVIGRPGLENTLQTIIKEFGEHIELFVIRGEQVPVDLPVRKQVVTMAVKYPTGVPGNVSIS